MKQWSERGGGRARQTAAREPGQKTDRVDVRASLTVGDVGAGGFAALLCAGCVKRAVAVESAAVSVFLLQGAGGGRQTTLVWTRQRQRVLREEARMDKAARLVSTKVRGRQRGGVDGGGWRRLRRVSLAGVDEEDNSAPGRCYMSAKRDDRGRDGSRGERKRREEAAEEAWNGVTDESDGQPGAVCRLKESLDLRPPAFCFSLCWEQIAAASALVQANNKTSTEYDYGVNGGEGARGEKERVPSCMQLPMHAGNGEPLALFAPPPFLLGRRAQSCGQIGHDGEESCLPISLSCLAPDAAFPAAHFAGRYSSSPCDARHRGEKDRP